MTRRKPPGLDFESWIDRQIREAEERGEFRALAGRPLPDEGPHHDELWWIKGKMAREGLSHLPPSLALRKEAEDTLAAAREAPSEARARRLVTELNEKIREALRGPLEGPPLRLRPYDVEEIAAQWRGARGAEGGSG
ncbi:DUF1992 domain-containing protein [Streptomyces sp. Tu6071]|uniref:DnaJ family domain-containing protein n=1 Tax=Streptomyces sp. Tu6071 TaxID=355249 RepID=UPI00031FB8A6|nr:DUF1992 domain-containing protein [Streptomyces sp. Tu6071]